MRILIAEDDSIIADGLCRSLRGSGYAVDRAANGMEADTALVSTAYDLLILDLGLPKLSGLEVLKRLRSRGSALPVLILTAMDGTEDRVRGLDLGADDYMVKPFELPELEARVQSSDLARENAVLKTIMQAQRIGAGWSGNATDVMHLHRALRRAGIVP